MLTIRKVKVQINVALTCREGLQRFSDDRPRSVDLHAAEVEGLGKHRRTGKVARYQEVADVHGMGSRVERPHVPGYTKSLRQQISVASIT